MEINEEKLKVINFRKQYSKFLGVKIKVVKKADKYMLRSYMSDKIVKCEVNNLVNQIKQYNFMVFGIHNYYRYATIVNHNCIKVKFSVYMFMYHQLRG